MRHVIFDFDGTIVDTLPVALAIVRQVLPEVDVSEARLKELRELPARDVIKKSGISKWRQLRLLIQGKKLLSQHLDDLKAFKGIDQAIQQLHQAGFIISVVSSNSESNIRYVLKREGIERYVHSVYGNVGLFSKARVFRVVLRDQKATASQAIYVGDEVRDIDAARRAGIPIVSVTWGYNTERVLKKFRPDFLVSTPAALVKAITTSQ